MNADGRSLNAEPKPPIGVNRRVSAAGIRTFEWKGHELEMRIYFTPRLLMFATDTALYVDARRVARKGGFGVTETAVGSFVHEGREVRSELQVRGGLSVFTKIPYVVRLDGVTVSEGRLKLEGIAEAVSVWLCAAGLLLILLGCGMR
jgi:hypothetical protein